MKSSFNADFYITAATVIPLLYVTLILQDSAYKRYMDRWIRGMEASLQAGSLRETLKRYLPGQLHLAIFGISWSAGMLGEALAVLALFSRSTSRLLEFITAACVMALLFTSGFNPLKEYVSGVFKLKRFLDGIPEAPEKPSATAEPIDINANPPRSVQRS